MRILGAYRDDAANYYRITAPFSVLRYRTGLQFEVGQISPTTLEGCDVLWLQQHASATTEVLVRDFRAAGGKVVYDVDDWLFSLPPSWPCYDHYYERGTGLAREPLIFHERLLEMTDVVTCTTEYLAERLRKRLGPEKVVRVLPNCILQGDWDTIVPAAHGLDGPVLGWFGTENHWDDWAEIVDGVDEALEAVGGHLALVGAPELLALFPRRLAERTLLHSLVPMLQFNEVRRLISSFDVGLAWCTEQLESNRCRSPLKAIQYGAAGVPVVASLTVYGDVAGFHEHAIVVPKASMLARTLIRAFTTFRQPLRRCAREWQREVWRSHSYERQAVRWLEVIEEVASEPAGD